LLINDTNSDYEYQKSKDIAILIIDGQMKNIILEIFTSYKE